MLVGFYTRTGRDASRLKAKLSGRTDIGFTANTISTGLHCHYIFRGVPKSYSTTAQSAAS